LEDGAVRTAGSRRGLFHDPSESHFSRSGSAPVNGYDVGSHPDFRRKSLAIHLGLCSAFACPFRNGDSILGVMEFFSRDLRSPDDVLIQALDTAGRHIGQFIQKKEAQEDRVKALEQLAEERALLRQVIDQAPVMVTVCEVPSGKIILGNQFVQQLWGHPLLPTRNVGEYRKWKGFHLDGRPYEPEEWPAARTIATGEVVLNEEIQIERADGSRGFISLSSAPVHDPRGQMIQVVATAIDITHLKHLENELRCRSEELQLEARRREQYLAMLAHELRNPLAPIRSAAHVLKLRASTDPNSQRPATIIERQAAHMARLVDDLLDVSRITHGKIEMRKEAVELETVLAQAVESCREFIQARKHDVQVLLPMQPVRLLADPARIQQVLVNLIENACKYSPPGSRIWVTAARELDCLVLRVRDTGDGISADLLPHVFDVFAQGDHSLDRSQGGLGVGLTLVRSIVELHGGTVEANSDGPGRGSEFLVKLPALPVPPLSEKAELQLDVSPARPARILVVEDIHDTAETLVDLLQFWGHEVRFVYDGVSAVMAAQDFRPEVVLLDLGLPQMDGFEVCKRLRDLPGQNRMRIVALTGYAHEDDRARTTAVGFDLHLVKPIDPDYLRSELTNLLAP